LPVSEKQKESHEIKEGAGMDKRLEKGCFTACEKSPDRVPVTKKREKEESYRDRKRRGKRNPSSGTIKESKKKDHRMDHKIVRLYHAEGSRR